MIQKLEENRRRTIYKIPVTIRSFQTSHNIYFQNVLIHSISMESKYYTIITAKKTENIQIL